MESQWQKIDTAPKDGTRILVWFRGEMFVAFFGPVWHPENLKWLVPEPNTKADGDGRIVSDISEPVWSDGTKIPGGHDGPTLWHPLPDQPND